MLIIAGFKYDLLEVGPLNMIGFDVLNKVRTAIKIFTHSFSGQTSLHGKTLELIFAQEIDYQLKL
jgi:hypothetical protein